MAAMHNVMYRLTQYTHPLLAVIHVANVVTSSPIVLNSTQFNSIISGSTANIKKNLRTGEQTYTN